jgi:DNA-binding NarL/FixJ family response regulator
MAEPAQDLHSPTAIRVFLVEDSSAVRELIVQSLDEPGIAWAGFSDSESDALEQLLEQHCDVLIVDIELRQGNGMSLLRKLAEQRCKAADMKIVFSNNICDAYRRAGAQYGVEHFLDKTHDMAQLCSLLQQRRAALQQA